MKVTDELTQEEGSVIKVIDKCGYSQLTLPVNNVNFNFHFTFLSSTSSSTAEPTFGLNDCPYRYRVESGSFQYRSSYAVCDL